MAAFKKVAIAGASGSLGTAVLEALLSADFTVTVLSRADSSAAFPSGVRVVKVDYRDVELLTEVLRGQDAMISTVGFGGMQDQTILVDAAIAAGVKRILPSEFGSDPEDSRTRSLPVFGYKVEVEHYCKEKVRGTGTSYTLVANNLYLDWALDHDNSFGVDIRNKKVEIFDGGDHIYSAAPLSFVARGIVAVLQHPINTANQVVRLHGLSMTQNRLQEILQRFTGKEGWQISHVKLADREAEAYNKLQAEPGNTYAWAVPFLHCAVYGDDFHNDFSENNDNALLGLQELSEAEIEEIVRSRTM